jgi:hypothetical protein
MSDFLKDFEQIDAFLIVAKTIDIFQHCHTVYELFGIKNKSTPYPDIERNIEEFVKKYAGTNAPKFKNFGKTISGEAERIKRVLKDHQKEYNDYLRENDPRAKQIRLHFDFCTKRDGDLDSEEKNHLIEEGKEAGLTETEVRALIAQWVIEGGVKEVAASSAGDTGKDFSYPRYYEILAVSVSALYAEIKEAYEREWQATFKISDKRKVDARRYELQKAWECLKDDEKRKEYDYKPPPPPPPPGDPRLVVECKTDYTFRDIRRGAVINVDKIVIKNPDGGLLQGTIKSDVSWLEPDRKKILEKHEQELYVNILTSKIPVNTYDTKGTVKIDTNGGPPYLIPFRVILEGLEIAADRFRKTYVPLVAACAGFIGSFSSSPVSNFFAGAFIAGIISYAFAKLIVKLILNKRIDIFQFPNMLIQGAAIGVAVLAIYIHSSNTNKPYQPPPAPLFNVTIAGDNVNVRAEPSTSSGLIARAKKGIELPVISTQHDWYQVKFTLNNKEATGWINKNYVVSQGNPPTTTPPGSVEEMDKNFVFTPNKWDEMNFGWQDIMDLLPGEYKIEASGTYQQASIPGGDLNKIQYFTVGVNGIGKRQYFRDKDPLTQINDGALIAKINGEPIAVGNEKKIVIETAESLHLALSVNLPQNWAAAGKPELNFRYNTGGFKIKIKGRRISSLSAGSGVGESTNVNGKIYKHVLPDDTVVYSNSPTLNDESTSSAPKKEPAHTDIQYPNPKSTQINVLTSLIAKGIDSNQNPIGVNIKFPSGRDTLCYYVTYKDAVPNNTVFEFQWFRNDIQISNSQQTLKDFSGNAWNCLTGNFEPGIHDVRLYVGGQELKRTIFSIEATTSINKNKKEIINEWTSDIKESTQSKQTEQRRSFEPPSDSLRSDGIGSSSPKPKAGSWDKSKGSATYEDN